MPARKRLQTYGKAGRKKLPFNHAIESKRAAVSELRDVTPAASVVDIFDVPSSDDDERIEESRKRKIVTKPTSVKKARLGLEVPSRKEPVTNAKSKSSALHPKDLQNRTIITPATLTQSELRMSAIRKRERIQTKTIEVPATTIQPELRTGAIRKPAGIKNKTTKTAGTISQSELGMNAGRKREMIHVKTSQTAATSTQSDLRMGNVEIPDAEQTPEPAIEAPRPRPKHKLVSRQVKAVKEEAFTVAEQMASVTLYTPKRNTSSVMDVRMSTSSSPTPEVSLSPVTRTPHLSPLPVPQTPRRSPLKATPAPQMSSPPATPTPHAERQTSISPEGKRMWQGLLGDGDSNHTKKRRRKLIDSLKEQLDETEDSDSTESQDWPQSSQSASTPRIETQSQQIWEPMEQTELVYSQQTTMKQALPASISQKTGLRTYASQRAFLAEPTPDFESQLVMDMPLESNMGGRRQGRGQIPALKPLATFTEAEDEVPEVAFRSVHEARLAGAKNHFVDGVENLFSDIGAPQPKPSSSRRSALMDLATKLLEKEYRRQFLENGLDHQLFVHMGQETDVVAGFLLASLLFIVLSDGTSSITIVQLRRQGISRLLIRLLEFQNSISTIAKDRKSNMSRSAQSLVTEYQTLLLKSEFWGKPDQTKVSPRTMALRCIDEMIRTSVDAGSMGSIISNEMIRKLFGILQDWSPENLSEVWKNEDFRLALKTIESHSHLGMAEDAAAWIGSYLPFVSGLLLKTLSQEVPLQMEPEYYDYFHALLKLVVGVTLCNEEASNVFSDQELMATMGTTIVSTWNRKAYGLSEEEGQAAGMVLQVTTVAMMNIVGSSRLARQSFIGLVDSDDDCLAGMVEVFNDREESSSQVCTSTLFAT